MSEEFIKNLLFLILAIFIILLIIPIFMMFFMGWNIPQSWGMMGGMMNMGMHMFNMIIPFWFFLLLFIVLIVGVLYLVSSSGTKNSTSYTSGYIHSYTPSTGDKESLEEGEPDIFKVLKPDEKQVVQLLIKNGGKMLQKDIRWELNMNRVQIHRILERLEERNIVSRKPVGNTNEVVLADWILKKYRDNSIE